MATANPFRPTFGVSPPVVAGRYDLIEEFRIGLQEGPGAPARASLYLGPRGSGKTVLLNELEDVARAEGWHVVSETASPGLIDRLVGEHLPALLAELDPRQISTRLKDASAFGVGIGWERDEQHVVRPGLRSQLTLLTDVIGEQQLAAGVLLTVDEIHGGTTAELRELATTVQHCFREQRPLAIAVAGLPAAVHERLLDDQVLTFFRRADRHHLGSVDLDDVAEAIEQPVVAAGKAIDADALEAAAAATRGYPFMIQMVGWQLWRAAGSAATITMAMVRRAVPVAVRRMGELVHEPALADLSRGDQAFLAAMATDDGPSRTGELARRMDVDDNWISQYRRRMIDAEIIRPIRRGEFDFELPYLREYLRAK
ncbi:ATP-binding protein [soil metagenome]